jgi:hypothetical protein
MSFNATTVVAAAVAHATQLSSQSLYANVDLTKVSWLEQMWAAWYIWIDNPVIATGLMSFLLHEVIRALLAFRRLSLSSMLFPVCILRTFHPLDYYRCHAIFPSVEAPA